MNRGPLKYDYRCYNQHEVLRPTWLFWLLVIFLSRDLLLLLLLGVSHGKRGGGAPNPAVGALINPIFFISDIPALLALLPLGARLPGSGRVPRFLWRHSQFLLLGSCLLYLALLFWQQGPDFAAYHMATWGMIALTCLVMVVLIRSEYLKDLFDQFPTSDLDDKN